MDVEGQVVAAAERRAAALVAGDGSRLTELLHEEFRWTTHRGESLARDEYVRRNTGGHTSWRAQELEAPDVVVVGATAVLSTVVRDVVVGAHGHDETFRMPVTQVWVGAGGSWRCLAGHAGPLLGAAAPR
jgi:uncharacterized protein DUF4440